MKLTFTSQPQLYPRFENPEEVYFRAARARLDNDQDLQALNYDDVDLRKSLARYLGIEQSSQKRTLFVQRLFLMGY